MMKKKKTLLSLSLSLCLFSPILLATPPTALQIETHYSTLTTQRQVVDQLLQQAYQAFKSPARVSHAGFTAKLPSNMELVAQRVLEAYQLEPYRADLLFSAANAYIYNKDVDKAISLFEQILAMAPDELDAHTYLAVWQRFKNDRVASNVHVEKLKLLNNGRYQQVMQLFRVLDHVTTMPISDTLSQPLPAHSAIVTLGYALNPDGSMHDILIQRLEKTRELAQQNPDALLIVTGGVPQANQTEGRLMRDWLVKKGINEQRIVMDNYATSTVENALYSRYALAQHRTQYAVILSSGSHVRRGQALFEIASWQSGPQGIRFSSVASLDKPLVELQKVSEDDKLGIYRDALRVMGLWSFRSAPLLEQ